MLITALFINTIRYSHILTQYGVLMCFVKPYYLVTEEVRTF